MNIFQGFRATPTDWPWRKRQPAKRSAPFALAIAALQLIAALARPTSALAAGPSCADLFRGPSLLAAVARQSVDPAQNEKLVLEVMRQTADQRRRNTDTVEGWLRSLETSQREQPLNVLEYTALLFIKNSGIFSADPGPAALLEASLRTAHRNLTGNDFTGDIMRDVLPGKLLQDAGYRATQFYGAVLRETKAQQKVEPSLLNRLKTAKLAVAAHLNIVNVLTVLTTAAALSFGVGREIFAGALIGLTQASMNEWLVHIGIGHAPKALYNKFRSMGKLGGFLEEITLAHKLHHTVVADAFGTAELTPAQKARAEKTLRKLAENLVLDRMASAEPEKSRADLEASPEFARQVEVVIEGVRGGGYGVNGTKLGAASMMASATPFYLLNFALYAATGSEAFLVTSQLSMTAMIIQSVYSHWYLHYQPKPGDETTLSRLQIHYVTRTWIGRIAQQLHYRHHELPYMGNKNGVIMGGAVADILLGTLEHPRTVDLINMYYDGFMPELRGLLDEGTAPAPTDAPR